MHKGYVGLGRDVPGKYKNARTAEFRVAGGILLFMVDKI